jgi:hypothetical protein
MSDDLERRLKDVLDERAEVERATVDRTLASIDALPPRSSVRSAVPVRPIAAALLVAIVGAAVLLSVRDRGEVAVSPSPTTSVDVSPSPAVTTPGPTVAPSPTLQPRPVWAVDLASHLDCDGPLASKGMDVAPVLVPSESALSPQDLLRVIQPLFGLPESGFSPVLVNGHWALYRYLVDGRPKVHAVATDQVPDPVVEGEWYLVGLRACDASEFDPADLDPESITIWTDSSGEQVHSDVISSSVGPGHCGHERTIWLHLRRDELYIRDPFGDLADWTIVSFDPDVPLPADAIDTGYHTDRWHLFTIPSGRAVFVRTEDGTIERWPRARDGLGCA